MRESKEAVAGLVLAAGRSTRMGEPKPLLEIDGRTFLQAAVEALRDGGCETVTAVIASPDAAFAARSAGAAIAQGRPDGEQIDSLRSGLDALDALDAVDDALEGAPHDAPDGARQGRVDAVVVLPVDHPRVRPATIGTLISAWRAEPEAMVRPVHRGRPGHPTLFPRRIWAALRDPALPDGARSVVEAGPVVDVPVDDPGVLVDIDTPADYREHAGDGHPDGPS
ncbi:MAG: nucleotidyltransferase family protein [Longimicrobiales bacterium]